MYLISNVLSTFVGGQSRFLFVLLVALCCTCFSLAGSAKTNLLLIVVDDMNANSVGAFGAVMSGTTSNIDELASEGIRFEKAHV